MRISLPSIKFPVWTRTSKGENFYDTRAYKEWTDMMSNLELAQNHPILTPALLFVSKLFSQAEFSVKNISTGSEKKYGDIIDLLDNPNHYQTRQDFLETLMFIMLAQGVCIVALDKVIGMDPGAMFVLDKELIEWPEGFDESTFKTQSKAILNKKIIYDKDGENKEYTIKNLMFFYDAPNMLSRNPFKVTSRIDGLKQTLINTMDSLIAKNIILKSNGKELITGKKDGFPLTPEEKTDIESLFNNKLGLSFTRKRGVITKSDVTWKSMHIALRDLGLDESVKVDGNLIYTALHIPKDILSLEAKKTTYNNFKESMVSYVQNEMQPSINSFTAVFNKKIVSNNKLKGSYEHLPIMQFILLERYDVAIKQATALKQLREAGVPDNIALQMCGMDPKTKLGELVISNNNSNGQEGQQGEEKTFELRKVNS